MTSGFVENFEHVDDLPNILPADQSNLPTAMDVNQQNTQLISANGEQNHLLGRVLDPVNATNSQPLSVVGFRLGIRGARNIPVGEPLVNEQFSFSVDSRGNYHLDVNDQLIDSLGTDSKLLPIVYTLNNNAQLIEQTLSLTIFGAKAAEEILQLNDNSDNNQNELSLDSDSVSVLITSNQEIDQQSANQAPSGSTYSSTVFYAANDHDSLRRSNGILQTDGNVITGESTEEGLNGVGKDSRSARVTSFRLASTSDEIELDDIGSGSGQAFTELPQGEFTLNENGQYSFVANEEYLRSLGTNSEVLDFIYRVNNNEGATALAHLFITIAEIGATPPPLITPPPGATQSLFANDDNDIIRYITPLSEKSGNILNGLGVNTTATDTGVEISVVNVHLLNDVRTINIGSNWQSPDGDFTFRVNSNGDYYFQANEKYYQQLESAKVSDVLHFVYDIQDVNGDKSSATLHLTINPNYANSSEKISTSIDHDSFHASDNISSATGNVITGASQDSGVSGADIGRNLSVINIELNNSNVSHLPNQAWNDSAGRFTMTINDNGWYSFTPSSMYLTQLQNNNISEILNFRYWVQDSNGNISSSHLFITVTPNYFATNDHDIELVREESNLSVDGNVITANLTSGNGVDFGTGLSVKNIFAMNQSGTHNAGEVWSNADYSMQINTNGDYIFNPSESFYSDLAIRGNTAIFQFVYTLRNDQNIDITASLFITVDPLVLNEDHGNYRVNKPFAENLGNVLFGDDENGNSGLDLGSGLSVSKYQFLGGGVEMPAGDNYSSIDGRFRFAIDPDGGYYFSPSDQYFNSLRTSNSSEILSFRYKAVDKHGIDSESTLYLTINPNAASNIVARNDTDNVSMHSDISLTNGNVISGETGNLSGVDRGESLSIVSINLLGQTNTHPPGAIWQGPNNKFTMQINSEGDYSFNPNTEYLHSLQVANRSEIIKFRYTVEDSNGDTSNATLAITVDPVRAGSGAVLQAKNDNDYVENDSNGEAVAFGNVLTAVNTSNTTGLVSDLGYNLSVVKISLQGETTIHNAGELWSNNDFSMQVANDGNYLFTPSHEYLQRLLQQGVSVVQQFNYVVRDSFGRESTAALFITLPTTNIVNDSDTESSHELIEKIDGNVISGYGLDTSKPIPDRGFNLSVVGIRLADQSEEHQTNENWVATNGDYSMKILANGDYVFNPSLDYLHRLNVNSQTEVVKFVYSVEDLANNRYHATLSITVNPNNQAKWHSLRAYNDNDEIRSHQTNSDPIGNVITGDNTLEDITDVGQELIVVAIQTVGENTMRQVGQQWSSGNDYSMQVNTDGNYSFNPSENYLDRLRELNQTAIHTFKYTVRDKFGRDSSASLFITVNPALDLQDDHDRIAKHNENPDVSGNLLSGSGIDIPGIDGGISMSIVHIRLDGDNTVHLPNQVWSGNNNAYIMEVGTNGDYKFNPSTEYLNRLHSNGQTALLKFIYTVEDASNTISNATLYLTVNPEYLNGSTPIVARYDHDLLDASDLLANGNVISSLGEQGSSGADSGENLSIVAVQLVNENTTNQQFSANQSWEETNHKFSMLVSTGGEYTFTPSESYLQQLRTNNLSEVITFRYWIQDSYGHRSESNLFITVNPIIATEAPTLPAVISFDDHDNILANQPILKLAGNVINGEGINNPGLDQGENLTISSFYYGGSNSTISLGTIWQSPDNHFQMKLMTNGDYYFNPAEDYIKQLQNSSATEIIHFVYTAANTKGVSSQASLYITINPLYNQRELQAHDDRDTVQEHISNNATPLGNVISGANQDINTGGDIGTNISITYFQQVGSTEIKSANQALSDSANNFTMELSSNGNYTFNPNENYLNQLRSEHRTEVFGFRYWLEDSEGHNSSATLYITVNPIQLETPPPETPPPETPPPETPPPETPPPIGASNPVVAHSDYDEVNSDPRGHSSGNVITGQNMDSAEAGKDISKIAGQLHISEIYDLSLNQSQPLNQVWVHNEYTMAMSSGGDHYFSPSANLLSRLQNSHATAQFAFKYTVSDQNNNSSVATLFITVNLNPRENQPPTGASSSIVARSDHDEVNSDPRGHTSGNVITGQNMASAEAGKDSSTVVGQLKISEIVDLTLNQSQSLNQVWGASEYTMAMSSGGDHFFSPSANLLSRLQSSNATAQFAFKYTVSDQENNTSVATLYITVNPNNIQSENQITNDNIQNINQARVIAQSDHDTVNQHQSVINTVGNVLNGNGMDNLDGVDRSSNRSQLRITAITDLNNGEIQGVNQSWSTADYDMALAQSGEHFFNPSEKLLESLRSSQTTAIFSFKYEVRDLANNFSHATLYVTVNPSGVVTNQNNPQNASEENKSTATNSALIARNDLDIINEHLSTLKAAGNVLTGKNLVGQESSDNGVGSLTVLSVREDGVRQSHRADEVWNDNNGRYSMAISAVGDHYFNPSQSYLDNLKANNATDVIKFVYTVKDSANNVATATLTISINPNNTEQIANASIPPVKATDDEAALTVQYINGRLNLTSSLIEGNILNNDQNSQQDTNSTDLELLSVNQQNFNNDTLILQGSFGSLNINKNGSYSYEAERAPDNGHTEEKFVYTILNKQTNLQSTATLTVTIVDKTTGRYNSASAVNATDDNVTIIDGLGINTYLDGVATSVLANDDNAQIVTKVNGLVLNNQKVNGEFGELVMDQFGHYSYRQYDGLHVEETTVEKFSYEVKGFNGSVETRTLFITIEPLNQQSDEHTRHNFVAGNSEDNTIFTTNNDFNTLIGGAGSDKLYNSSDKSNTFKWNEFDYSNSEVDVDVIYGFKQQSLSTGNELYLNSEQEINHSFGDKLDLKDLLNLDLAHTVNAQEEASELINYLHFEKVGNDTLIHVNKAGEVQNSRDTLQILLKDVDLINHGDNTLGDQAIIQELLQKNKLIID